jgi:peptidoglycan/xylan/chitin deacetylase (PgdA/CDA1 family)
MSVVPIFCYHGIGAHYPPAELKFAFSADAFISHLDLFAARGLRTITIAELARARRAGDHATLSGTVAITFDDGYADLATVVLPLLAARRLVATAFVTTSYVAARDAQVAHHDRWLSSEELRTIDTSGHFEIGGHSHLHLPLDQLANDVAAQQLGRCQAELTSMLGHAVQSFAYPYGYSTRAVRRLAADAGFSTAVGVKHARSGPDDDLFDLARVRVLAHHDTAAIAGFLDGRNVRVGPCREELRTSLYRPVRKIRSRLSRASAS